MKRLKNSFLRLVMCSGDYLPHVIMAKCDIDIVLRYYLFDLYEYQIMDENMYTCVIVRAKYKKWLSFYFKKRLNKMKKRIEETRAVCIQFSYT